MEHPLFKNRSSLYVYFLGWILVAGIHFGILYSQAYCSLWQSLADSLVWNILLALLGLASWTPVRFNMNISSSVFNMVFSHLTALILIILLWIGAGKGILSLIIEDEAYHAFLTNTLPWRIITATLFYLILALIYYLLISYQNMEEKLRNESQLQDNVREAEINLLKSQINPHFLFNSLNSVSSLTLTNPTRARDMIIKLSDFLRYGVSKTNQQFTTFEQEMENIKRYLDIEKVRFGEKLLYQFTIPESCKGFTVPVMILQPLYENAVKHGVYESLEPVCIKTEVELRGGFLWISIENDFDPDAVPVRGTGTGLTNTRQRLRLIYGSEEFIKVQKEEKVFRITLQIPEKSI